MRIKKIIKKIIMLWSLSISFSKKCMEINVENFYVDIGIKGLTFNSTEYESLTHACKMRNTYMCIFSQF